MLKTLTEMIPECIGVSEVDGGAYRLDFERFSRFATKEETAAALAAEQEAQAKRVEADTARDDAKRALAALDTIIAGAPTATNAQMRTWLEQLARISKHHILATVGR